MLADMIRYNSQKQMTIGEFKTPFQARMDKGNRWVKLAESLPWDSLADIYYKSMSKKMGAPTIDGRIVIGAMVIKHLLKLDDRETIETIRENPYMQYFLGLSQYTYEDVFDRSLFTTLRYRLGADKFDAMTREIIMRAEGKEKSGEGKGKTDDPHGTDSITTASGSENTGNTKNDGTLIVDATVADQMIVYPTDLGLLARSREESERIIDNLCLELKEKSKPRTYRRKARKQYLLISKKKIKGKREIHKALGQQLRYLKRNVGHIEKLLDKFNDKSFPLDKRDQKIYWVIQNIYNQQLTMYKSGKHSIEDRIVNIYQPYVRPIIRGKDKAQVEFGSKLGVSLQRGYARLNTLSWDAYNESSDLKKQVEDYKDHFGYYPEVIITDKIYGNRENRQWLKERNIRFSGKPLGRPSIQNLTAYQKRKQKRENGIRNQIEGKFGQGKNGYNLNKIRARAARTSESWIACILFVMNLIKFSKDFLFSFFPRLFQFIFSGFYTPLDKKIPSLYFMQV